MVPPPKGGGLARIVRAHLPRIFPLSSTTSSQQQQQQHVEAPPGGYAAARSAAASAAAAKADGWRAAVRDARVVYFGERHEQFEVLASQLSVLQEMHVATTEHMGGATPGEEKAEEEEVVVEKMEGGEAVEELSSWIKPSGGVSVVFEMFLRPRHQELLDAFLKEAQAETPAEAMEDVEELETRLEAAGRSGFTTQHYGQLLLLARELGDVTALAGFPPRSDAEDSVKVAAREGYAAGLARARAEGSLDIAASLGPEVEAAACALPCESHFNVFESIFTGRDPNDRDALTNNFRRIFPAQCVADAICAATVLERLAAGDRVLVILGCGHTDYGFGVPQRVELGLQALKHRLQNEGTGMLEPYRGGTDLFEPKEAPAEVDFTEHAGLGAVRITSRSTAEPRSYPVLQERKTLRTLGDFVCLYESV